MKKALIFAMLLTVSIIAYGQKVTIALNLVQGNTYYMITNAKAAMTQNISGQPQDMTTTISGKMAFKVMARNDTAFLMEAKYEKLRLQIGAPGVSIDLNSESTDRTNPITVLMNNMTRGTFTVTMSNKGRVLAIDNFDKMLKSMFAGLPQVTEVQKEQFKNQMLQSFGPKALTGSIEIGTVIFPPNKVAKNDKWVLSTNLESAIKAKVISTYTLQDITDTTYQIHGDAVIEPVNSDYVEMNGVPMKYVMNGASAADITVDKATGWISGERITQAMKGIIEIKDNPKTPGGMTIPMSMNVEQIITDK